MNAQAKLTELIQIANDYQYGVNYWQQALDASKKDLQRAIAQNFPLMMYQDCVANAQRALDKATEKRDSVVKLMPELALQIN